MQREDNLNPRNHGKFSHEKNFFNVFTRVWNFYNFQEKRILTFPTATWSEISFEKNNTHDCQSRSFTLQYENKWIVIKSLFTKLHQFKLSTLFHCHCYSYALRYVWFNHLSPLLWRLPRKYVHTQLHDSFITVPNKPRKFQNSKTRKFENLKASRGWKDLEIFFAAAKFRKLKNFGKTRSAIDLSRKYALLFLFFSKIRKILPAYLLADYILHVFAYPIVQNLIHIALHYA